LACYVKQGSGFEVAFIAKDETQLLVLEKRDLRVVGLYRPFTNHNGLTLNENFDCLMKALSDVTTGDKLTMIGGDFNLDYLRMNDRAYPLSSALLRLEIWAIENGLTQHICTVCAS